MKSNYEAAVKERMMKQAPKELLGGTFRGSAYPHIFKELKDNFIDGTYPTRKCLKGTYMQRRYRTKKYYCGEYLEVAIYPVYTHPKKRGKWSKPTTEIQQRLNQRHTEGRLRRLLHTNFTPSDLFATLTFDDANLPA